MDSKQVISQAFVRIVDLLEPDKTTIAYILFYATLAGLINLSLPLGLQALINLVQAGGISVSWIVVTVFVLSGVVFTGFVQVMQLKLTERLQQRIFTRAAFDISYRLPKIKLSSLQKYYAPELMNRFFDTLSIQKGLAKLLVDFSGAVIQVLFGLLLLSLYHSLYIGFSLLLIVVLAFIIRYTAPKGLMTSLKESAHKYETAHWIEELSRVSLLFKQNGEHKRVLPKTDRIVDRYLTARNNHFRVLITQFSLLILFKFLVVAGLLLLGTMLVLDGRITLGQFVGAEIIVILVMTAVEKIIFSLETMFDVLTSVEKLGTITDLPLDKQHTASNGMMETDKVWNIEIKGVNLRSNDKQILKNVNAAIKEGDRIFLDGESGAGKSTFIRFLAGLYPDYSGRVLLNNMPLPDKSVGKLRACTSYIGSTNQIFEGTILENVTLFDDNPDRDKLQELLHTTKLDEDFLEQELHWESTLLATGQNIPRRARQRILAARAIYKPSKMLLIDTDFDGLNQKELLELGQLLLQTHPECAVLVSDQSGRLAKFCNRRWIMEEGQITEYKENKTKTV